MASGHGRWAATVVFVLAGFVPRLELIMGHRRRLVSFAATIAAVVVIAVPLTRHTMDRFEEIQE
ncbi:MAG: hypothetical protein ACR2OH_09325 [Microthrixaceae bacterium]